MLFSGRTIKTASDVMTDWPIWMILKNPDSLAKLVQFQWEQHGENLLDSLKEKGPSLQIEDVEEIDRIMRKRPDKPVRVK